MLVLILLLPEPPRWLALHNRKEEALEVLSKLHGKGATPDSEVVQSQYNAIMYVFEIEGHSNKSNFAMLFSSDMKHNFRRVCLGVGVIFMNPWTGINIVTYYFPYILTTVLEKSSKISAIISGCVMLVSLIFGVPTVILIDRVGRKRLLSIACAVQAVCLAAVTGLLRVVINNRSNTSAAVGWIAVVFVYMATFSLSWLPTTFPYGAELLPNRVRSKGCALGATLYWLGTFATSKILPIGIANISYRFFIIFAVLNVVISIILGVFYKETAGLSLEEIELSSLEDTTTPNFKVVDNVDSVKLENGDAFHLEKAK